VEGGGPEEDWRGRTAAVEGHAACARVVVLVEADALDTLLGHHVAGCEEHLFSSVSVCSETPRESY
jgi:hypothetical protein